MPSVKRSISSIVKVLLVSITLFGCSEHNENTDNDNTIKSLSGKIINYVGSQQCVSCHKQEYKAWHNSHHDLAMQSATEETVLGDFSNSSFDYFGTVSKFYKKNDLFYVQTDRKSVV